MARSRNPRDRNERSLLTDRTALKSNAICSCMHSSLYGCRCTHAYMYDACSRMHSCMWVGMLVNVLIIYIYMHPYACMHACTCVFVCIFDSICVYICVCDCGCVLCACACACVRLCAYACDRVRMRARACLCVCNMQISMKAAVLLGLFGGASAFLAPMTPSLGLRASPATSRLQVS